MIKLSFIVPVYNVAPYLRKCVESLLMQDYDNYEIILVDDGSTDDSGAICDEYAASSLSAAGTSSFSEAEHSIIPIRVIHQPNAGLSAARNAGVKCAEGKYICFVDSDDYWEPNVLGGLMAQVEREQLDVLRFDYQNVRLKVESGKRKEESEYEVFEPNKTPRYIDKRNGIVDGETYLNTRMGYACYAVMFVVKRSLLIGNLSFVIGNLNCGDCLFTKGIHFEDVDWLPRMMLRAKRVNSTTTTVYNYLVRQGSITKVQGNKEKIRKNVEDRMTIIETYSAYIEQYPTCAWLKNMQSNMAAGVLTTVAMYFYSECKSCIERLREWNIFPLTIADQGKTYTHRAKFINLFGPTIFCSIMNIRKRIL